MNLASTFGDVGTADTHICTINWDGGVVVTPVAVGAGTCTGSASLAPGVYNIKVTVTDDDAGSVETQVIVIVYDPRAGFVTGGGWINSPAGAYPAAPALTGKGRFGFVSKYKKGATAPSGNTEFEFEVAGFTFQSTAYQWLVVAGARAVQGRGHGQRRGQLRLPADRY